MKFGKVGRRVVEAAFDGADIVSDGGALPLKQVDDRIGLTRAAVLRFAPNSMSFAICYEDRFGMVRESLNRHRRRRRNRCSREDFPLDQFGSEWTVALNV